MKPKAHPKEILKAIAGVELLLLEQWNKSDPLTNDSMERSVSVYPWGPGPWGFRVSEVGFVTKPKSGQLSGMSGFSYMDCDDVKFPAIIERLILEVAYLGEDFGIWEENLLAEFNKR